MPAQKENLIMVACGSLALLKHSAFVPPPQQQPVRPTVPAAVLAGTAALAAAEPALAKLQYYAGKPTDQIPKPDDIEVAARMLTGASYALLTEVDWNSLVYLTKPGGSASAIDWLKAVDTALVMGNAMDPKLLKQGVEAHIKAIEHAKNAKGITTENDFLAINTAIGKMIASVPEEKTMAVYNSFSKLVGPDVPKYLMSTVNGVHAEIAYKELMKFKDVVKAHPIKHSEVNSGAVSASIASAAKQASLLSYPFIRQVDWTSELYRKPLPGATAKDYLAGVDAALKMGVAMDPYALHGAVEAHHKAISGVDAMGVPKAEDYEAIIAGIGQLIASVPASKTMDVYNAFARTVTPDVAKFNMAMVNSGDARAAYSALMDFKDVVKAAQR